MNETENEKILIYPIEESEQLGYTDSFDNVEVSEKEILDVPLSDFDISDIFDKLSPEVVRIEFQKYIPYEYSQTFEPFADIGFTQEIFNDYAFIPNFFKNNDITTDFMTRSGVEEILKYAAEKLASLTPKIPEIIESTDIQVEQNIIDPIHNTAPTAANDSASVAEDSVLTIPISTLLSNDSDIDGDALLAANFSIISSSHGTAVVQGTNVIFTPDANYNGPANFVYQIADGQGGTSTATTNITVTPEVVHLNSYVFLSQGLAGGYARANWTTDSGTGATASNTSGTGNVAKYYNLENSSDLNAFNQADQSGHKPLTAATCTLKDTQYDANTDTLTVRIDDPDSSKIKNIEIGMDYDTVDNLNIRAFEDVLIKFLESDHSAQHTGQTSDLYVRDAVRLDADFTKALGDIDLILEAKGTGSSVNAHANIDGSTHADYVTISDNGTLNGNFSIDLDANDGADRLIIEQGFLTSLNVDMGSGNDAIFMEGSTGTLHGGSGTDILYLSGNSSDYNITNNQNGTYTITGVGGMNMVYDSIEQIIYSANMNNVANAGG